MLTNLGSSAVSLSSSLSQKRKYRYVCIYIYVQKLKKDGRTCVKRICVPDGGKETLFTVQLVIGIKNPKNKNKNKNICAVKSKLECLE